MTVNEALKVADRLNKMYQNSEVMALTREELQQEIVYLAKQYQILADKIDEEMAAELSATF